MAGLPRVTRAGVRNAEIEQRSKDIKTADEEQRGLGARVDQRQLQIEHGLHDPGQNQPAAERRAENDRANGGPFNPAIRDYQFFRRQQFGQDAVFSRWMCRCAEAYDTIGQKRVHAGQQCETTDEFDCIRHQHHAAFGHCIGEGADKSRQRNIEENKKQLEQRRHPGRRSDVMQQGNRGNEQRVIGERREKLRRHDGIKAILHQFSQLQSLFRQKIFSMTQPKIKSFYVCNACGARAPKLQSQCPACDAWNTLTETATARAGAYPALAGTGAVQKLAHIEATGAPRISSGLGEFDRVLGGGLVAGGVALIGGDPGIGKSTLLLQSLAALAPEKRVLYVSAEESEAQIALRAQRLGLMERARELRVLAEIQLEKIQVAIASEQPSVAVIDSIQTIYSEALSSAPGSVAQVRECAAQLTRLAKQSCVTIIMVGHVTKEGSLAGPRVLEHIVDTVLYFEGESHSTYRLVRAFKNRFGAVNELGVFAMTERGLRGVSNPSALFLSHHPQAVPGSCVLVTQEGSRPLLVEIQALVDTTHVPNPRRLAVGLEQNRLALLLAVLHRHAGIACFDQDVFLNAVGGVKITEPAADLAVLLAIHSSLRNQPLPRGLVVFGEVGLAGETRPCPRGQERLREAAKLGFSAALIPKANAPKRALEGLEVRAVERIEQSLLTV